MDQTAITYPYATLSELTGETIKTILEDVGDNLFNPDPYYQQGGDMVRVGGLAYTIDPNAKAGSRISRHGARAANRSRRARRYKVAGWAPVAEEARAANAEPMWDVVERHLKRVKTVRVDRLETPTVVGMQGNPGMAA